MDLPDVPQYKGKKAIWTEPEQILPPLRGFWETCSYRDMDGVSAVWLTCMSVCETENFKIEDSYSEALEGMPERRKQPFLLGDVSGGA